MKIKLEKYLLWFVLIMFTSCGVNVDKSEFTQAIKEHDFKQIKKWVDSGLEVNQYITTDSLTPLVLSIQENCDEISNYFIEHGADLKNRIKGSTPMHYAIRNRQIKTALLLIQKGADLNTIDSKGYVPLHLAAMKSSFKLIKGLVENGCEINFIDLQGNTALNFAKASGNSQIIKYLLKKGAIIYKQNLPETTEGPVIKKAEDKIIVQYLKHNAKDGYSYLIENQFESGTDTIISWYVDSSGYYIRKSSRESACYTNVEKIFAVGDIHGQYDRMIRNLKSNGIVDENLRWNWGDGHVVFVGDIMDRGGKVTECLWFIYHLEQQAEKSGGKVHLILGNHELLVFKNDLRYVAKKYRKLCDNLGFSYVDMYNGNTVLGEWLRTRNTMLKINDILFVHAGISNDLANRDYSIEEVNNLMCEYLLSGSNSMNEEVYKFLLGSTGPIWYRGYFKAKSKYPKMKEEELKKILNQYNVSSIVVGHTETDILKTLYDGGVVAVNIPLWNDEVPNQALLIDSGKFFRLEEGKKAVQIK